jgi:hypothetical protein
MKRTNRKLDIDWTDKAAVRLYKALDMRRRRGSTAGEYKPEPSKARKTPHKGRVYAEILGIDVRVA